MPPSEVSAWRGDILAPLVRFLSDVEKVRLCLCASRFCRELYAMPSIWQNVYLGSKRDMLQVARTFPMAPHVKNLTLFYDELRSKVRPWDEIGKAFQDVQSLYVENRISHKRRKTTPSTTAAGALHRVLRARACALRELSLELDCIADDMFNSYAFPHLRVLHVTRSVNARGAHTQRLLQLPRDAPQLADLGMCQLHLETLQLQEKFGRYPMLTRLSLSETSGDALAMDVLLAALPQLQQLNLFSVRVQWSHAVGAPRLHQLDLWHVHGFPQQVVLGPSFPALETVHVCDCHIPRLQLASPKICNIVVVGSNVDLGGHVEQVWVQHPQEGSIRSLELRTVVPRIAQDMWNKSIASVSLDFQDLAWSDVVQRDLEVHVYEALYCLLSNAKNHLDVTLHGRMALVDLAILATIRSANVDLCNAILPRTYWLGLNPSVQNLNVHQLQSVRTLMVVPCMQKLRIWDMPMLNALVLQPGNHVLRELTLHGLRWVNLDDVLCQLACCPQLEHFTSSDLAEYTPQRLWLEHPNLRTLSLTSHSTNWLYLCLPLLREAHLNIPTPVGYPFVGNLQQCTELAVLDLHCHCTCADLLSDTFLPPHLTRFRMKNDRLNAFHLKDLPSLEELHLDAPSARPVTLERLARLRTVVLHSQQSDEHGPTSRRLAMTECPLASFRSVCTPLF